MGAMLATRTVSRETVPAADGTLPHLFLLLVCSRLAVPSMRLSLRGTEELTIGRGDLQRGPLPRRDGHVALAVPDDRMSVRHAAFRRVMGTWVLADAGSRNGTFVNGHRIEREVLADGDLVELGHSFFLFRSGIVASAQPVAVDLRMIAATQQDLDALVSRQQFRGDLLARLSGLTFALPALRERREDLGLLIRSLLKRHARDPATQSALTCDAARALLLHSWPRNVRELDKALQAALVLAGHDPIGLRHLPANLQGSPVRPTQVSVAAEESPTQASPAMKMQHFIDELWRRHVVRVLVAYSVALFGALQGADVIVTRLSLPPRWMTWIVAAGLVGFPVAGVLAWVFDWTRQGIVRTPALSGAQQTTLAPAQRGRRNAITFAGWILFLMTVASAIWWRIRHT